MKAVFGLQVQAEVKALESHLLRLLDAANAPLSSLLLVPSFLDAVIHELIAKRRTQPPDEHDDVLSLMLQARDEQGTPLTDEEVRDELMTLVVAGHETTATALCWAVQCLLEAHDVHRRLQDELDHTEADAPLAERLSRLPYLDAVIKETLRLRPVVPIVGRRLHAPMEVAGGVVAPGTVLAPCIYLRLDERSPLCPAAVRA